MRKALRLSLLSLGVFIVLLAGLFLYLANSYYPPILMYHHIDKDLVKESRIAVAPEVFQQQMSFIKENNYQVISLEELCMKLKNKEKLDRDLVVITFDDGYKDNIKAAEILKEYDFPATFFKLKSTS